MTTQEWTCLRQKWAPRVLGVLVSVVVPFTVTTSYRAGAEVTRFETRLEAHERLDTLILRRLDQLNAKADSTKTTVDSLRWLILDRERRNP